MERRSSNVLKEVGPRRAEELRERIAREVHTTFASHYVRSVGLFDLLDPQTLADISKMTTGRKYLPDLVRPIGEQSVDTG